MANAVLDLCAFVVREGWEQREDEGDYPRGLAQKALAEADSMRAEIAALKAEVTNQRHEIGMLLVDLAAHKRALAAGPAALRIDARDGEPWGPYKQLPVEEAVATVEAAQAAAMKEKP